MATLSTVRPTLIDIARATDPNGQIAKVAKVLQQFHPMMDDIPWVEGNLPTGNVTTIQSSIATPSRRSLNSGVAPTKSTTAQINDACSIYEDQSHVDVDVANLNGNSKAYRLLQDSMKMQGFVNTLGADLIYGNSASSNTQFNGLAVRYFSLGTTYTTSAQIIDAGASNDQTDCTSIWLIGWGEGRVSGIYPKGSIGGLQMEDRGIENILVDTTNGKYMRAYVSWLQWKCGLAVNDYRYVVRIANIDTSKLATASDSSDTSANIMKYMSMALDLLPDDGNSNPIFYMTRKTKSMLRVKMQDKSNLHLTVGDLVSPQGITRRPELMFQGIPVRRADGITETESVITTATT